MSTYRLRPHRAPPPFSPSRRRARAGANPIVGFAIVMIASVFVISRLGAHQSRPETVSAATALEAVAPAPTAPDVAAIPAVQPTSTPAPTATSTADPTMTPEPPSPTPTARYAYSSDWLAIHPATAPPQLTAKSAIVVDYDTHRVLFAYHEHDRRPQASTTKIMTADVAIDVAPLDTPIRVTKDAVDTEPDHMGVQLNEVLTLDELLYGLLLDSGNDAAYTIADGLGGMDAFVAKMNQKASELQLHDTHFQNPAGFDDPGQYTSAYDLAVQTTDALRNHPEFRKVVSTKKQIIYPTKTHGWFGPTSLNNLLWNYQGAFGVKPGLTDNADYCLVAAATRNGHTVISVVMGVPTDRHFTEGALLLTYGFQRISEE